MIFYTSFFVTDDTDYSESEGLSSTALSKRIDGINIMSPTSVTSETEEESRDGKQNEMCRFFFQITIFKYTKCQISYNLHFLKLATYYIELECLNEDEI